MLLVSSKICDDLWLIFRKKERLNKNETLLPGQVLIDDPECAVLYDKGLCVYSSVTGRVYPAEAEQSDPSVSVFLTDWERVIQKLRADFVDRMMSRENILADDWIGRATEERDGLLAYHGFDAADYPRIERIRSGRCPLCGGQLMDGCCLNPSCNLGKSTGFLFEEDGVRLRVSGKDGLQFAEKTDLDRIRDGNFGA